MKLISSYPRSGSARLRQIICHLNYPLYDGSFDQMSRLTPSIDNPDTRNDGIGIDFMVTHSCIDSDIYLYRHVGDCLVSEYWFKQKFYPSDETLEEFIIESNYGEQWRRSVEAGRAAKAQISFKDLGNASKLYELDLIEDKSIGDYQRAINETSFDKMRKAENEVSFYYLPQTESKIKYMRSGKSGQWKRLAIANDICRANESELLYLNLMRHDEQTNKFVDIG